MGKRFSFTSIFFTALSFLLFFTTEAGAYLYDNFGKGPGWPNKVDDHIDSLYAVFPDTTVNVIVDICCEITQADIDTVSQYGELFDVFGLIDAIALRNVRVSDCYNILKYSRVKMIEWDRPNYPDIDISVCAIKARASTTYTYPKQAVWALNMPRGFRGKGINVAIIDSGVDDNHPALAGKFIAGYDAFTGVGGKGTNPDDAWVNWYHGTAVASMIMANDPNQQYCGVAPEAGLIDCKVFQSGPSPGSVCIRAIQWCISNRSNFKIDVINMSFSSGASDGTDAVSRMADAAVKAGIVAVSSSGNRPPNNGVRSPGAGNGVIAVSAVNDNATINRTDDYFDPISVTGPRPTPPPFIFGINDLKPEVSAYGTAITVCQGIHPGQTAAGFWQHPGTSGTSWATAHTSGVCALLLEKYPGTPPGAIKTILRTTAGKRGTASFPAVDPIYNIQYGWGIVDAAKAVNSNLPADVYVLPYVRGSWNNRCIWANLYPIKAGQKNTLNARIYARGGPASNVIVDFSISHFGWSVPWEIIGRTQVNVPYNGSAVASIPFTPQKPGHKCIRVQIHYTGDTNAANNTAQENIDVVPLSTSVLSVGGIKQRYEISLWIGVEPSVPLPWRSADACICTDDLPPESKAWIEPVLPTDELPMDILPGEVHEFYLIVEFPAMYQASKIKSEEKAYAVHVNGWYWGNSVNENGVTVYFGDLPAMACTIPEIQFSQDSIGQSPMTGQQVTVSGIVTAGFGIFPNVYCIQEDPGSWQGIFISDAVHQVQRGDSITITGTVVEKEGQTEIGAITDFLLHSSGRTLPEPVFLCDVKSDSCEAYEGVLVKVDSVHVVDVEKTTGDWWIANSDTFQIGNWAEHGYVHPIGDLLSITGIVCYEDSVYKIQPRSNADILYIETGLGGQSGSAVPVKYDLLQNYPNPFNPVTVIEYQLPYLSRVRIEIYDMMGRKVKTLVDKMENAGYCKVEWDSKNEAGKNVSSGVYIYRIYAAGKKQTWQKTRKMVLIK
ncbi:S8 family serine peptidase [candidate division KSB1 bacterium]|nr:S8 family serine peptidase [candidate division KSB1 bacterium]